MSAAVEPLATARTPGECYSWLPREELTRMAMVAYEMSRLECHPKPGESFSIDGDVMCDQGTFLSQLIDNLHLILAEYAAVFGIHDPTFLIRRDPERLAMLRADYRQRLAESEAL